MTRLYEIMGECMVLVNGAGLANAELGLASEPIQVSPEFHFYDVHTDDYGPKVPAERLAFLGMCKIKMTLVHYDQTVLNTLLAKALAGSESGTSLLLGSAGKPLGQGAAVGDANCNYVQLTLQSLLPSDSNYVFPACHLSEQPVMIPLGVERSLTVLTWSSIPYFPNYTSPGNEVTSNGRTFWQRT